jgi:putative pyruvate formate lyase activating enzyme
MDLDLTVRERAFALRARLAACDLCPRACGVDRLRGELGFCRTAEELPVAHIGLHFGEEPPISGTRGSGTIFFARCNARCVYCQNYQISQRDDALAVRALSPEGLAAEMVALQGRGAHNVNLVSPTHVAASVARALCIARARGLTVPVVYNTGGYDAVETLRGLEGLVDIYLPDIKYSDDRWARTYSRLPHYVAANRAAIAEMYRQVGDLTLDAAGVARRGLLVRHLVLPADRAGSEASLAFLASLSRQMVVSLMAQYAPHHRAGATPPLDRRITAAEYERVLDIAWSLGLERCFVQALDSREALVPDFRAEDPFA